MQKGGASRSGQPRQGRNKGSPPRQRWVSASALRRAPEGRHRVHHVPPLRGFTRMTPCLPATVSTVGYVTSPLRDSRQSDQCAANTLIENATDSLDGHFDICRRIRLGRGSRAELISSYIPSARSRARIRRSGANHLYNGVDRLHVANQACVLRAESRRPDRS